MSTPPDFAWPRQTSPELIRRIHTARMQVIDTHAASARQSARAMVSEWDTQAMAERDAMLQSAIRQHRAPPEAIAHYLWSRDAISDAQAATMDESVGIFVRAMKRRHCLRGRAPRALGPADIPADLASPAIVPRPPSTPRKIARAFDRARRCGAAQQPLSVALPDIEATRRFRQFVRETCERKLDVLERAPVQQPETRRGKLRRQRAPLYVK
jgi:hypothetical protein